MVLFGQETNGASSGCTFFWTVTCGFRKTTKVSNDSPVINCTESYTPKPQANQVLHLRCVINWHADNVFGEMCYIVIVSANVDMVSSFRIYD